jgi:hypothetical protein
MLVYALAAFAPLPEKVTLFFAFAFGPLLITAFSGYFYIGRAWKDSLLLRIGLLFNTIGAGLVTAMLAVQQASFAFHEQFKAMDRGEVSAEQLRWMFKEVNAVQLGMDIAWDIFISAGTILFALSLFRHPVFGRILPSAGALLGALLLIFNMTYFPEPPVDAQSIDFGPFVALWYVVLSVVLAFRRNMIEGLPAV